jgi:hypothetical protein
MDDDKSMELRTGVTAQVTLKGTVGAPLPGPISFGFSASGSMIVDAAVVHSFREEEEVRLRAMQDPNTEFTTMVPDPVTALTVTPSLDGSFQFSTRGTLFMTLHLALFDVSISKDLWAPKPAAATIGTGRWPEKERLRIGTAHEVNGTLATDAQSHWPGGANFASFPQSIAACLGPNPAVTALSTPCGPITTPPGPGGTTTAVQGNLCVYYPTNWDTDPDLDPNVRTCKTRMSGYAQSSVTLRQKAPAGLDFAGQTVDAHPIKMTSSVADTSDRQILAASAGTCATAYGTAAQVASEIHVAPCDATGKLFANWIDGTQAAVDNTPTQSSIETPGTCP